MLNKSSQTWPKVTDEMNKASEKCLGFILFMCNTRAINGDSFLVFDLMLNASFCHGSILF